MVIPPAKPDKPNREFGFIHFAAKETVDKLIADAEQGTKPEMDGKTLEVRFTPLILLVMLKGAMPKLYAYCERGGSILRQCQHPCSLQAFKATTEQINPT